MEADRTRQGDAVDTRLGVSPTRSTRFSQSTCIHCGLAIVAIPQEQAECERCHKRRIIADLQRQIADKQRKAVTR